MGEFDIPSLLTQNEEHKSRLFAPYNPLTGEGSPIERVLSLIHIYEPTRRRH